MGICMTLILPKCHDLSYGTTLDKSHVELRKEVLRGIEKDNKK